MTILNGKRSTTLCALTILVAGSIACMGADDFAGDYEGILVEYDSNIKDGVVIQQSLTSLLTVTQQDSTHYTATVVDGDGNQASVPCLRTGQMIRNATRPLSYPGWNLLDFIMVSDGTNKACTVIGQNPVDPLDVSFTVSAWSENASPITADDFVGTWQVARYNNPNLRSTTDGFDLGGMTLEVTKAAADRITVTATNSSGIRTVLQMQVAGNEASLVSPPVNTGHSWVNTFRMWSDGQKMVAYLVGTELNDLSDVSVALFWGDKVPVVRDLAVISIKASKKITLTARKPSQTKYVKVSIQNRGEMPESIPDLATLAELVTLEVESLGGTCSNPAAVFLADPPQRPLPVTLKPKQKFNVVFNVTYDCANDGAKSTKTENHADFKYIAEVRREVLDGLPDMDLADDVCPHDAPVGGVDPLNPKLKDKGAGGKKPDHTLGADVLTDVVVK